VVYEMGAPEDVVFVSTFLGGFAPFFASCGDPESVCRRIREDLLKAKDLLELSESQTIWTGKLESALAPISRNYVKFDESYATYMVPGQRMPAQRNNLVS
jgi:hypothetical protein